MLYKSILATLIITPVFSGCLSPNHDKIDGNLTAAENSATFYVDKITGGSVVGTHNNAFGFNDQKTVVVTACLNDRAARQGILNNQKFSVSDGVTETDYVTDYRGCILWKEVHDFDYFAPESYMEIHRTITAKGAHSGSYNVTFLFNPWQDGPDAVRDPRVDPTPAVINTQNAQVSTFGRLSSVDRDSALLDVSTVNFKFVRLNYPGYKVDSKLNLTVVHTYHIDFTPETRRRRLNGEWTSERPSDGTLMFTMLLFPDSSANPDALPDPKNAIVAVQKRIKIEKNRVLQDIKIEFPDLAATTSRMRAIIEIKPEVESPSLGSAKFSGVIGPLPDKGSTDLSSYKAQGAAALYGEYLKLQVAQGSATIPTVEAYVADRQFKLLKASDVSGDPQVQEFMQSFLEGSSISSGAKAHLFRSFCQKAFGMGNPLDYLPTSPWGARGFGESVVQFCQRAPEQALEIVASDFVESLESPFPKHVGYPHAESLSFDVSFTKEFSEEVSSGSSHKFDRTVGAGANAGAEVKAATPDFLGGGKGGKISPLTGGASIGGEVKGSVGLSFDWFNTWARGKKSATSRTLNDSRKVGVSIVSNQFEIKGNYRRCVTIQPNRLTVIKGSDKDGNPEFKQDQLFQPFMLCAEQAKPGPRLETYYLMTQTEGAALGPFSDNNDSEVMPLRAFIRGARTFGAMKSILDSKYVEFVMKADPQRPEEFAQPLFDRQLKMTQDYPGMIVN